MGDIHTQYTSDIRQVEKNNLKLERQNTKLIEQNRRLKVASRAAGRQVAQSTQRSITSTLSLLGTIATVYRSTQGAIRAVSAEIKDTEARAKRAGEVTRSIADREAGMINMLGDVSPKEATAFFGRVDKLVNKLHAKGGKGAFYEVLETTLSAAGDQERAIDAATVGTKIGRKSQEEAVALAGGVLDIAQVTGEVNDMMKNAGFLIAATTQARVTSLEGMSKYGAIAAGAVHTTGGTAVESMALFTALTKALQDAEGRRAKTAAISLAEALKRFLPEKDVLKTTTRKRRGREYTETKVETAGTGLTSPRERIEHLWKHPELVDKFDKEVIGKMEKGVRGGVRKLLGFNVDSQRYDRGPDTLPAKAYQQAIAGIPDVADARPFAERKIAVLESRHAQKVTKGSQVVSDTEEALITGTGGGRRAAEASVYTREELNKLLAASGAGAMNRTVLSRGVYDRGILRDDWSARNAFNQAIAARVKALEYDIQNTWFSGMVSTKTDDPDRLLQAKILREGMRDLDRQLQADLLKKMDQQTEAIERQTRVIEAAGRKPTPEAAQGQLTVGAER